MPRPKAIIELYDENDDLQEIEVQGRWEICGNCNGDGSHCHSIDGNGLPSEFESDPEFMESYLAGDHDQNCEDCGGSGKVFEPIRELLTPEQLKALESKEEHEAFEAGVAALHARGIQY